MAITLATIKGAPLSLAEADGNIGDLDGRTAAGWADIVSELYYRDSPATPTASQYKGGIYLPEFLTGQTMEAFATFHVPHTWKPGTMLYPHMHFVTASNAAGVVRWGFEYTWARRHDSTGQTAFQTTQTLSLDFTIAANSADKHFVAEMPEGQGITGTNLEVDAVILMRVFREGAHGNDTFGASAFGICCDLHIEVDRAATPSRAPDFYS